jgi:hypothetical protein
MPLLRDALRNWYLELNLHEQFEGFLEIGLSYPTGNENSS